MLWTYIGHRRQAYADDTGRVVGTVEDAVGCTAIARANGRDLGEFVDVDSAMRAVEAAVNKSAPSGEVDRG
jgi:hypothetical protein